MAYFLHHPVDPKAARGQVNVLNQATGFCSRVKCMQGDLGPHRFFGSSVSFPALVWIVTWFGRRFYACVRMENGSKEIYRLIICRYATTQNTSLYAGVRDESLSS